MGIKAINSKTLDRFRLFYACVCLCLISPGLQAATIFKIATIAPEGSQWMTDLKAAGKQIAERTENRVKLKFYGGGVMGNDKKILRKMRIGQLHGGAFTSSGLSERFPEAALYGLPMVFENQEEIDFVRSRMDKSILRGMDKVGLVGFGIAGGGFAKLMGAEPITRIEELRGKKVWVPEGDRLSFNAMEALDISPVVLPITDVLTGLQTGLLEYVATPPVGAIILQWYTKVKYMNTYPFAYTVGVLAMDKKMFASVSAEDQAVMREVLGRAYDVIDQRSRVENQDAERALRESGLKFVNLEPEKIAGWQATVAASTRKMAEKGEFSLTMYQELMDHLAAYRAGAGATQAKLNSAE